MRVLGIETSCDETGVAIYDSEAGLLVHRLYSQTGLHAEFGGVVPELASRDHIRKLAPMVSEVLGEVLREALAGAGIDRHGIDGVAYTRGPGLVGALMVGACFGRSLAYAWGVPALGVHHMEGHLLAPMLEPEPPAFPFIALLVSGGHTQLVRVDAVGAYKLLGESLDDAAGEAFDKAAKMLELGYPGGPKLAALAETGDDTRFDFPRPMVGRPGLDFSFSGLKTYTLNTIAKCRDAAGALSERDRADIAAAFQRAVVETLVIKCRRALKQEGMTQLVIAGGVSANRRLRAALDTELATVKGRVYYPRLEFCTDNGAMIAYAGYCRLRDGLHDDLGITVKPRWPMTSLAALSGGH